MLFPKCRDSGQSEYLALLDWRNTPSEGMETSPAQRFLGRHCRTRLPTVESLLAPHYPTQADGLALRRLKKKQQTYYNQHTKELKDLQPGKAVQMRLPGETTWSSGECIQLVGPRSYKVHFFLYTQLLTFGSPKVLNNCTEICFIQESCYFLLWNINTHSPQAYFDRKILK